MRFREDEDGYIYITNRNVFEAYARAVGYKNGDEFVNDTGVKFRDVKGKWTLIMGDSGVQGTRVFTK